MGLAEITVTGVYKSADGVLLKGKDITFTPLAVFGDDGIIVPKQAVKVKTNATTAAFSITLLTSDVADAYVRYQVEFIKDNKKKFDLTDDVASISLEDLINAFDPAMSPSDSIQWLDHEGRITTLELGGGGSETLITLGALVNSATAKATPVDADQLPLMDSEAANITKKLSWANLKATLVTYFNTVYQAILVSGTNIKTINGSSVLGAGDLTVSGGASSLDDLTDVVITAAASGEFIRHNGTNWVDGTIQAADIPTTVDAAKLADGSVSNAEFQHLNGVTSAIQTQIDGKSATGHNHDASYQPLDADLTAIAALAPATANVVASDGAGWIAKTYAQLKTALGLVKADVGLGNVDNTSDAAKPISTATQTALDLKANDADVVHDTGNETIAGIKTFSSSPIVPTPTTDFQASTKKYVDDAIVGSGGYTDEQAQDAVGAMVDGTLNYNDATPLLKVADGGIGTTQLADAGVTLAKQANMATASVVYRKTAGSGAPEVQTLATLKTDLGLTGTNSGDQDLGPYFHKTNDDTDDITEGTTKKFATAAEKTKLGHITVTQAVDLDAMETKLDGVEALADVTDATNVDAAGAVMNSDTSTAAMSFVVDEDDMVSDSATKLPTQQSVKAYVDAQTDIVSQTEAGTTKTLAAADDEKETRYTNAGTKTLTLAATATVGIGHVSKHTNLGSGALTIAAGGMTVRNNVTTVPQYGSVLIQAIGTDEFLVIPSITDSASARIWMGVEIGADVQAWSANLDEYAAVNPTAAGLALLDDADATAQRTTLGVDWSKSIAVEDPTNAEDISMFFTTVAITITEMVAVLIGSASPSVTWTVRHGTDRSGAGAEVVTGGTTTTSTTTGSVVTSFNDATIPADSFVWLETTAQSGTVDELSLTLLYTKD